MREKQFFGAVNAARYCGLSRRYFGRCVERFAVPMFMIGRSWFFLRPDLDRLKAVLETAPKLIRRSFKGRRQR